MGLKVGDNAIGRIIMRKYSWSWFEDEPIVPTKKVVARKGYTPKEKGYGISTYTKKGVWCHA